MHDKAIAIVCEATGYDKVDISSDDDAQTLELWDSIAHVNIILAIETHLNRPLDPLEIIEVSSIQGIQNLFDDVQQSS